MKLNNREREALQAIIDSAEYETGGDFCFCDTSRPEDKFTENQWKGYLSDLLKKELIQIDDGVIFNIKKFGKG